MFSVSSAFRELNTGLILPRSLEKYKLNQTVAHCFLKSVLGQYRKLHIFTLPQLCMIKHLARVLATTATQGESCLTRLVTNRAFLRDIVKISWQQLSAAMMGNSNYWESHKDFIFTTTEPSYDHALPPLLCERWFIASDKQWNQRCRGYLANALQAAKKEKFTQKKISFGKGLHLTSISSLLLQRDVNSTVQEPLRYPKVKDKVCPWDIVDVLLFL